MSLITICNVCNYVWYKIGQKLIKTCLARCLMKFKSLPNKIPAYSSSKFLLAAIIVLYISINENI